MKTKASDIGRVFTKMREEKTWSQKELASKAGVSIHKIKWYEENEQSLPAFDTVVKVAKAFGYKLNFEKMEVEE